MVNAPYIPQTGTFDPANQKTRSFNIKMLRTYYTQTPFPFGEGLGMGLLISQ